MVDGGRSGEVDRVVEERGECGLQTRQATTVGQYYASRTRDLPRRLTFQCLFTRQASYSDPSRHRVRVRWVPTSRRSSDGRPLAQREKTRGSFDEWCETAWTEDMTSLADEERLKGRVESGEGVARQERRSWASLEEQ